MTDTTPKYGVHLASNGSAGYARDYVAADTLREAREALREFADGVGAVGDAGHPGADLGGVPSGLRRGPPGWRAASGDLVAKRACETLPRVSHASWTPSYTQTRRLA